MEIWTAITGHEGRYAVSNLGRVKSLKRNVLMPQGHNKTLPEKILKPSPDKHRRLFVTLWKMGKPRVRAVHQLVLEEFEGPCPPGLESCHNDGDCQNNRIENLRWDTRASNVADKKLHGVENVGVLNHFATLTEAQVLEIRSALKRGERQRAIGARYGITQSHVSNIGLGKFWRHL